MKKTVLTVCALFLALVCLLGSVSLSAETVGCRVDGAEYMTLTSEGDGFELPAPPAVSAGKVFAGWYAELGGEKLFYPAGAVVNVPAGTVFDAVIISYSTNAGATVRFVNGDVALRFTSQIGKSDYETLASIVGEDGLSFGTYIVPRDFVVDAGNVFTLEALAAKGHDKYIDVSAESWYSEEGASYTVAGSVANILGKNRSRPYSGIGYMKVTYSDGTTGTVYSEFNWRTNSCNIFKTVVTAYDDREDSYPYLIPAGTHSGRYATHSLYTVAELDMMKAFLDKVVAINYTTVTNQNAYKYFAYTGACYTSPWVVGTVGDEYGRASIVVTAPAGTSISDAKAIWFGGSYRDFSSVVVSGGSITLQHDSFSKPIT